MNEKEMLELLLVKVSRLQGAQGKPYDLASARPVRTVTDADVEATKAGLSFLGGRAPSVEWIRRWLQRRSPSEIVAGVDSYLEPFRDIAIHPSSALQPGQDWREIAAWWAAQKSKDEWEGVFTLTGAEGEREPEPNLNPLPSVFDVLGEPVTDDEIATIAVEVMKRAEEGITWAGNRALSDGALATVKARLSSGEAGEWSGFLDPRLGRVLALTGDRPTQALKSSTLETWLVAMWATSRPNPGSDYWKRAGAREGE